MKKTPLKCTPAPFKAPVIVGGSGGSGTRMICAVLAKAGVFMARYVNPSNDAMFIDDFLNTRLNDVLAQTHSVDYTPADISDDVRESFTNDLLGLLYECHSDYPAYMPHWGFKHPRSAYIVPFLNQLMPKMRFIHVIRDGRDMAFSSNHNQARLHYAAIMGEEYTQDSPTDSIKLWQRMNLTAAEHGKRVLGDRYMQIRYEDICEHPEREIQRLLTHIGLGADSIKPMLSYVKPSSGIGRWKTQDTAITKELHDIADEALRQFGYL